MGSVPFIYFIKYVFSSYHVLAQTELNDNLTVKSHELRLHEINTLEWDDLVVANDHTASATSTPAGGNLIFSHDDCYLFWKSSYHAEGLKTWHFAGKVPCFHQEKQTSLNGNSIRVRRSYLSYDVFHYNLNVVFNVTTYFRGNCSMNFSVHILLISCFISFQLMFCFLIYRCIFSPGSQQSICGNSFF